MNATTVVLPLLANSPAISARNVVLLTGNAVSADFSSPQPCHRRNAPNVRRNAISSMLLVTRRSAAVQEILTHAYNK